MKKNIVKKPLVSVIMPVKNGERFLRDAAESVMSQTYRKFELWIVDDGSTDNTPKIIADLKREYRSKIKTIRIEKSIGAYRAANKAIAKANGEFLAPMDSDDLALPTRLEKQVEFLANNTKVIVVGSNAEVINESGSVIGEKIFAPGNGSLYEQFGKVHPMVHPATMIRRSMLPNKNSMYLPKYGVNSDYYTFFTLLGRGEFANIQENLIKYRVHDKNSSLVNVRVTGWNTVKIRLDAAINWGYKMSFSSWIIWMLHLVIVVLVPNVLLRPIYMNMKGFGQKVKKSVNKVGNYYQFLVRSLAFLK